MAKKTEKTEFVGYLKDTHVVLKSEPLALMRAVPFSLEELKVLDTYISRINSHDEKCRTVTFTKSEYEELMGLSQTRPETLKKYLTSMLQKIADIPTESGYRLFSLFTSAVCEKNEYNQWNITLTCSEEAKYLFFNVEQLGYFHYELKNVLSLTSKYSFLLYLYLRKERYRGEWIVPLEELRDERLDLKKNEYYKTFKYFKRDILDKAVAEINAKTDVNVTYSTKKRGKYIVAIEFTNHSKLNIEPVEEPKQLEGQTTFDDLLSDEQDDTKIKMLSEFCKNTFTPAELTEFLGVAEGDVNIIKRAFNVYQVYNERKPIKRDKRGYFLKVLATEQEKARKNKVKAEATASNEHSYDLDEFENFALHFNPNEPKGE